ncbi:hypothetical protein WR164_11900 [Philodulcilactobacillus myokoensis]|uniref:Uncharacterized protein n=1 Tax=Philodulcilactobacillus myokoensis TaxID=2929573 RepID=A0A9W6ESM7_9LACO|nr:hypothetical protein [Philodulcilactobacillus myokoensis]GLB47211.1 hypothetical protein WR164_11900 [Philodulcilactobacillus myokoensis]
MDNYHDYPFKIIFNPKMAKQLKHFNASFASNSVNMNSIRIQDSFANDAVIHDLIHGYIQMGNLNQQISNEFIPCEEDADQKLKQFLNHNN